jgi:hypothetical protein
MKSNVGGGTIGYNLACRIEGRFACSHVSGLLMQPKPTAGPDGVREPRPHHSTGSMSQRTLQNEAEEVLRVRHFGTELLSPAQYEDRHAQQPVKTAA